MDQKKIGGFLKQLRKERALTQEQLAEQFHVTGRSVSRWENGNNLPDLAVLVALADYYGVELREILKGERESVKQEETETAVAVAKYSSQEKTKLLKRMRLLFLAGLAGFCGFLAVQALGLKNVTPYQEIASFGLGFAFGMTLLGVIFTSRHAASIQKAKERLFKNKRGL